MSVILLPDKWRRQPPGPVGIDRSNALTNGLSSALSGVSGTYDLAKNTRYALESGVSSLATNKGIALSFNGSTDGLSGSGFVNASSQWTMATLVNFASTTGYTTVWSTANAANAYASLLRLDNNSRLTVYQYDSFADPNASDPATVSSGVDYFVVAVWSGSVLYLYKNGALLASTSVATIRGPSTTIRVGQDGTTNGKNAFTGTIPFTAYWDNRALSGSEVSALSENPWQIFRKKARIIYFPSAGGGASISGALESISLSTFGATVGSARAVAAALESLALTTSAARVSSDRAITASVESISITTSPARIASDRAVAAATEQLTVTPATASVALVSGIAAGTEALSVTANPATVALAASIAATLEAITVTGLTATVSTSSNTNISAALESITVTVNPATVSRNTALAAALESLTVTPHAASIAVGQIVAAALESLTLTSYPAGIALDVAVAAQIEQINLATFAAQVGLGTNVAALTEALTLTPHGATLTFAPSVGAARESITVTTFTASVIGGESILTTPGLEFTIPLNRLGYTIPIGRIHFTIPQE